MVTVSTALDALSAALAVARKHGREVRSIKDLLCDACGVAVALRGDYCHACADSIEGHYEETADAHAMSTDDGTGSEGFAEHCAAACDDPEGAAMLAGLNPGKF